MKEDLDFSRATRLRAMAHEMLALADEIENKYTIRKGKLVAYEFASLQALAARAAREFLDRQTRKKSFDLDIFGEPGWDMLLYLFVKKVEKQRARTTQVTGAAGVPTSTAFRYLSILEDAGLIETDVCANDNRVKFVTLTVDGMVRMSQCLARALRVAATGHDNFNDLIERNPTRTTPVDKLTKS